MLGENRVVYFLPGILSRGEDAQPLGLEGKVVKYDKHGSKHFEADWIVKDTVYKILPDLHGDKEVWLIGASLGGMLIPFIIREIRDWLNPAEGMLNKLHCVIIDSPSGVETLIAARCSPFVGRVIRSPFGQALRPLAHVKMGPKDEYIDIPDADTMREIADGVAMSADDWREYVKRRAIKELGGHSSRQWLHQLRWMTQVGRDDSLRLACGWMKGIDTTYVACISAGNNVVKQPLAMEHWQGDIHDLKVYPVNGVHCGFLQQARVFRGALKEILG